ncbi:MAG: fasciclin domain-containing protein [Gaiella sp.]
MRKIIVTLAVASLALAAIVAPATAGSAKQASDGNIVQTAVKAGQFKTLVSLVKSAGLAGALSKPGANLTVFAPTDAAFAKVPKATLAKLGKDKKALQAVLLYHVVKGKVPAATVVTLNGKSAKTLNGAPVKISVRGGSVFLNGSTKVVKTDVMASNGIIHVINKVLLPPAN